MDIQRLKNPTTGLLHTEVGHIYEDLCAITGEQGLMTNMLPQVMRSVEPWLCEHVTEPRFLDGKYDQTHTGAFELPEPTKAGREKMFERYKAQPTPLG